jgi:hypothetical protein
VYRRGDMARHMVVNPIPRCVRVATHHDFPECLLAELATQFVWHFCKDCASENLDAFGAVKVKRVRGTLTKGPTLRLKVRLLG